MATPITELVTQAENGNLSLKADPAAFVALEKAMTERIQRLMLVQQKIRVVAHQEAWGLGESSEVLTSAQTLVRRFREKAEHGPNNAVTALQSHIDAADEMRTLFRAIRQRIEESDAAFAAKFKELATAQGVDVGGNR
ncbi:hypothetical protein [Nocardia asteroides]|uniref:hypothetical protein n=1 Tax=Nocardia asteroides TaxID=1824 RepID=UPI001E57C494|nr:hypothetical protein [Nocardia asteroides]UGT53968.1 hypothetical protein LTT85_25395 [Nocardia asteroides]